MIFCHLNYAAFDVICDGAQYSGFTCTFTDKTVYRYKTRFAPCSAFHAITAILMPYCKLDEEKNNLDIPSQTVRQGVYNLMCPRCKKGIRPGSKFCGYCGKDLAGYKKLESANDKSDMQETGRMCKFCGGYYGVGNKYCGGCGRILRD